MAPVALVTGSARRIGAVINRQLHQRGHNVIVHYHRSASEAQALVDELNATRAHSAVAVSQDLLDTEALPSLIDTAIQTWGRLDLLVNNASSFYPTHIGDITSAHWEDLLGSNLKAPLFLAQAAMPHLRQTQGSIVNIVDVHAQRPLSQHPVYCAAKAGLASLTQSLAKDCGPEVRVNGVSPGSILWPEQSSGTTTQDDILRRTALKRSGTPEDIAQAVVFLACDAPYVTGQILAVDGGRSLSQ